MSWLLLERGPGGRVQKIRPVVLEGSRGACRVTCLRVAHRDAICKESRICSGTAFQKFVILPPDLCRNSLHRRPLLQHEDDAVQKHASITAGKPMDLDAESERCRCC